MLAIARKFVYASFQIEHGGSNEGNSGKDGQGYGINGCC